MVILDTRRNAEMFSVSDFRNSGRTILVIGVGMLGSHIASLLAKLGLDLTICDFDRVDPQNVCNQAYGIEDVGRLKVDALKQRLERDCGVKITAVPKPFTQDLLPASFVFAAPDSNDVRKEIWSAVKRRYNVELYIEVRTAALEGRVYTLDPWHSRQAAVYESPQILYPSSIAIDREGGACQAKTSLAFTAQAVAALAVTQFVLWHKLQAGEPIELNNEIIHCLYPAHTYTRCFV